jgi:hypothetical protein
MNRNGAEIPYDVVLLLLVMAGADVATTAGGSVLTGALSGLMVMVMLVGVEQS